MDWIELIEEYAAYELVAVLIAVVIYLACKRKCGGGMY